METGEGLLEVLRGTPEALGSISLMWVAMVIIPVLALSFYFLRRSGQEH